MPTTDEQIANELARLLATWLVRAHKIREGSFHDGGGLTDGYHTKEWEQCAREAGMPEQFRLLVPILMSWPNDTEQWIFDTLGVRFGADV